MTLHTAMVWAGDVLLALNFIGLNILALYAWKARKRDGPVLRRMAEFLAVLALYFCWFTIVYWDRRWNVVPGVDLHAWMGFEWYWVPRLLLFGATASLLLALMRTRR